jgi:hypothetical protein
MFRRRGARLPRVCVRRRSAVLVMLMLMLMLMKHKKSIKNLLTIYKIFDKLIIRDMKNISEVNN